jgi:hypothetical protein
MEAQTTVNFFSLDVFSPLACLSIVAERALASLPSDTAAQVRHNDVISEEPVDGPQCTISASCIAAMSSNSHAMLAASALQVFLEAT